MNCKLTDRGPNLMCTCMDVDDLIAKLQMANGNQCCRRKTRSLYGAAEHIHQTADERRRAQHADR